MSGKRGHIFNEVNQKLRGKLQGNIVRKNGGEDDAFVRRRELKFAAVEKWVEKTLRHKERLPTDLFQ